MRLTSVQRKILPDEEFGLPEDRKYYLGDKEHVIKAIVYFGSCERTKRNILADNINIAAMGFGLKVNVSKTNPFYKYASPEILKEDAGEIINESWMNLINPTSLLRWDKCIDTKYAKTLTVSDIKSQLDTQMVIYLKTAISYIIDDMYININDLDDTFINGWDYVINSSNDKFAENLFNQMSIDGNQNVVLNAIELLIKKFNNSSFGRLKELLKSVNILKQNIFSIVDKSGDSELMQAANHILQNNDLFIDNIIIANIIPDSVSFSIENLEKVGLCGCDERTSKLKGTSFLYLDKTAQSTVYDIGKLKHYLFEMFLDNVIDGFIYTDDTIYMRKCKDEKKPLSDIDEIFLVPYAINTGEKVKLLCLPFDDKNTPGFICIKPTTEVLPYDDLFDLCTEGLKITKDGSVTFDISKYDTYMDKYSDCHKLLVANDKSNNNTDMKHNLAYMFSLISVIEKKYIYNKEANRNSDEYKDALKARSFAINDFKTYYKKLNAKEKNFNFTKYYTDNNYDKNIYTITPDSVTGIKNLFRALLM